MKNNTTQSTKNQLALTKQDNALQGEAETLIAQAINNNVPVESLERLLAMRRELKQERAKESYDHAMADFQAECPTIQKTKQAYNYKYAALETIVEQVKALLAKNGFSYTFDTDEVEHAIVVSCKVKHIAGHMELSKATIARESTSKMNASQQSGAAMTYGKRYAFCNAFGILTGDEDNDGASEQKNAQPVQASITLDCETCGAPASERKGTTKVGDKPYHGIFCSTKDKTHTRWINDQEEEYAEN